MSLDNRPESAPPLTSRDELFTPFRAAFKPVARHRIALEHESIALLRPDPVPYLGARASHGLDMMLMPGTAQATLDYADEADLAHKLAAATSISPLVTALFAASPLVDMKPSGYMSYRMRVWQDVDPDRTGLLGF